MYDFSKEGMRNGITFYRKINYELVNFIWMGNEAQDGYRKWWEIMVTNPEGKGLYTVRINQI